MDRKLPPIIADALRTLLTGYDVAALFELPGDSNADSSAVAGTGSTQADEGDDLWASGRPVLPGGEADPLLTEAMDVVRSAEAVKAFTEALALQATATAARHVQASSLLDPSDPRYAVRKRTHDGQALEAVAYEVALLTGASLPMCRDRVRIAIAHPSRCGEVRRALAEGRTTFERLRAVWRETSHLDPLTAAAVMDRCLASSGATSLDLHGRACADRFGGIPVSHRGFRQRMNRQLSMIEGGRRVTERRKAERLTARDARCDAVADGIGLMQVEAERSRVFAAWSRVDRLARAARSAGDARPLNQLRSDLATTLLMAGTVPGDTVLDHAPPARLDVTVSLATLLAAREIDVADLLRAGAPRLGEQRPAKDVGPGPEGVGEVPALGFLAADAVRRLLFTPGTIVRRLVTDPVNGVAFDAAETYRVPAAMAHAVRARDHTCRAPGCEHPASSCDLDHDANHQPGHHEANDPWHRGDTHPDNLAAKHRGHHELKTRGFWSSRQLPNGQIRWRTLSQRLATEAFDHAAEELQPILLDAATRLAAAEAEFVRTVEPLTSAQAALDATVGCASAMARDERHERPPTDQSHRPVRRPDEPPF